MKRSPRNPIITRESIVSTAPGLADVSSVFNPGAVKVGSEYILLLRVQNRARETSLVVARSRDGLNFDIDLKPIHLAGLENVSRKVYHIYDPRISPLDGTFYIMVAMDMDDGCFLGLAQTADFREFTFKSIVSPVPSRNGVLFPERVDGKYLRLERPNRSDQNAGVTSGSEIHLAQSDDLLNWTSRGVVMAGRQHFWDELIASGPPPVKTTEGWLHIYHGIATHFASVNIYQAGVVLLDLKDTLKVIARSRYNILEPRESYEMVGQVPNVVFPSGMIIEKTDEDGFARPDSKVFVYYGAADTAVGLATTTVRELIAACYEGASGE